MPIPNTLADVLISPLNADILDVETVADGNQPRILWTNGESQYLFYSDLDGNGDLVQGTKLVRPSAPYNDFATGVDTFPNGAEWGRRWWTPHGPTRSQYGGATPMGCYYTKWREGELAEILFIVPPASPAVVVVSVPDFDAWLFDAWRVPALAGWLVYSRVDRGYDPVEHGEMNVFDPSDGSSTAIPNLPTTVSNTTSRVFRIVEEHLAVVMGRSLSIFARSAPRRPLQDLSVGDYDLGGERWQLAWQSLDPMHAGISLPIGPAWPTSQYELRGVGVRKLTVQAYAAANRYTYEGYFVYGLRRELVPNSGDPPVAVADTIDYYVIDYDSSVPRLRVIASGRALVPPLPGPDGMIFAGIGDDENYIDPDGNPCIALALVQTPNDSANTSRGVIAVFTAYYAAPEPGGSPHTFHVLTPSGVANPERPRKDPEPVTVGSPSTVYIYHRELANPGSDPALRQWELHRTLAWEP